ncbi:MAG: hypothetical protein J5932_10140 [Prevotella sp.]|nr:hypothetical protein [Prevotella sp.]
MTAPEETHRMGRRSHHNDYSSPGIYHITIKVNPALHQPLGVVTGDATAVDGAPNAPHVALSDIGNMVAYELTHSITAHYPMVKIEDYVIMPEHLHAIVAIRHYIISQHGRQTHLGQIIAGFKKGCNRQYWALEELRGKPATAPASPAVSPVWRPAVSPRGYKVPSSAHTDRTPLFSEGYVDVIPIDESQLSIQRQYIHNNPRSRLLRTIHRESLQPQRHTITTALSTNALKGYLQRECPSSLITSTNWQHIMQQLLLDGIMVICDSYGDRHIMTHRLLPVVCHRNDTQLFQQQKQRCLEAAKAGAVLVSARIAKGEQEIIDTVLELSLPVIIIEDNGFPQIYHPSEKRIEQCLKGLVLLITPWRYIFRHADEHITVSFCKTMNCVVQSICRTKDSWWKI